MDQASQNSSPASNVESEGALYLTPALLTLQVAAYLFLGLRNNNFLHFDPAFLLANGASQGIAIFEGEFWRLFTALFVPAGPYETALVLGGISLFSPFLERKLGILRTLVIYLICGWAGLVIGNFLAEPEVVLTGALGAVFGLASATIIVRQILISRELLPINSGNPFGILIFIGAYFALTWMKKDFDQSTFMGGMLTGFGLAFLLFKSRTIQQQKIDKIFFDDTKTLRRITAVMLVTFLALVFILSASPNVRTGFAPLDQVFLYSRARVSYSYLEKHELKKTLPILRTLAQKPASDYPFYNLLSNIEMNAGNLDEAINAMEKALEGMEISKTDDTIPVNFFDKSKVALASYYFFQGKRDAALEVLEQTLNREGKAHSISDSVSIASHLMQFGEGKLAENYLQKAIELYPDEKQLYLLQLELFMYSPFADRAKAMLLLELCKTKPAFKDRPWIHYIEGRIFEGFTEYRRAEESYLQAAELAQKNKMPYDTIATAEFWFHRGLCYSRVENYDEALPMLEKAFNKAQNSNDGLNNEFQFLMELLRVYKEKNDQKKLTEKRDAFIKKLKEETPESGSWVAHNELAYFLAQTNFDLETALNSAKKSVGMLAAGSNLDTLAWVQYRVGNFDEALKLQQQAIEKSHAPDSTTWFHLGAIHEALANNEDAKRAYKKALEPGVDFFEINECREALKRLEKN